MPVNTAIPPGYRMSNENRSRRARNRPIKSIQSKAKNISSKLDLVKEFVLLVLETSSIHGFNHIANKNTNVFENVLWIAFVAIGAYGAVFLAQSTMSRFNDSPTVISLERNYKDWNTTFPAVTICPFKKIDPELPEEFIRKWFGEINNRTEVIDWLDNLAQANFKTFDQLKINDRIPPSSFMQVLTEARFKLMYSVSDSNSRVGDLTFTVTEAGLCYTFNSLVAVYSSPEYWANSSTLRAPNSVFKGSPLDGDVFAQVMDLNSGYSAYIHSPYEIPDVSTTARSSQENLYLSIDVTALSTISSEETRVLPITRRKCRFMEESNLKTSPVYSFKHCRAECRMILAYKLCKCIPYFYRPMEGYPTCSVEGMKCLGNHKERLIKLHDGSVNEDCPCLPPCNDVVYNIYSTTTTPWYLGTNLKFGLLKYPRTRLKRDLLFTESDLLVQLGGSASLCLGCSVLSFCEIVYLLTLRLFLFIRERR